MTLDSTLRVRVAPSPTGLLHVGVTRTAIFNWLLARHCGGKFVLRIEDTDQARCRPEYLDNTIEALQWLGLRWDEGPVVGGDYGPYIQSQRLGLYRQHAQALVAGGHAYYCYCSPQRLADLRLRQQQRGEPAAYDGLCRCLTPQQRAEKEAAGAVATIRFAIPDRGETTFDDLVRGRIAFDNATIDDFIILKSDGFPTYHLASVVDDHQMRITHVLRADEWVPSTPRHLLLYQAFGWQPPAFAHLPMVLGPDRAKLSKRHGATALTAYRDQGYLPEALLNFLALLGWSPGDDRELMSRDELIQAFSIEGIGVAPSIFDITKLQWMNGEYIRACTPQRFAELSVPYLVAAGLVPADQSGQQREYARRVAALAQERVKALSELPSLTEFFFRDDIDYEQAAVNRWLTREYVPQAFEALAIRLERQPAFDVQTIEQVVRELAAQRELKAAALIHPIRVALTGRTTGPGLFETMHVLGRERVAARLRRARDIAIAARSTP
jgi:glutamyl-tRNA synthetase